MTGKLSRQSAHHTGRAAVPALPSIHALPSHHYVTKSAQRTCAVHKNSPLKLKSVTTCSWTLPEKLTVPKLLKNSQHFTEPQDSLPHSQQPVPFLSQINPIHASPSQFLKIIIIIIYVMELGHLLTRSGLTYTEVSSKVYHDSFCQLDSSVSLPWVICFEAFHLHVVSNFSCEKVKPPRYMA